MNGRNVALPHPSNGGIASQGTLIESSRVAAEVYAAILVAQQCPRVVNNVIRDVEEVCRIKSVAEGAFYRFPRGTKTVTGPTIKLMLELARIWGNLQWGMAELARRDTESEILSFCWDAQTNARSARIVIVPTKRDKSGQDPDDLTSIRDILNNNTNIGSRQLRETIEQILPVWLVDLATKACRETLADGGGIPLPQRRAAITTQFRDRFGVTAEQLEGKLHGRKVDVWDGHDLATLKISWDSLKRGDVTVGEEFPVQVMTSERLAETVTSADPAPGELPGHPQAAPRDMPGDRDGLLAALADLFLTAGTPADKTGREKRCAVAAHILGLDTAPANVNDLTDEQLGLVVDQLLDAQDDETLISQVETSAEAWRDRDRQG